MRGRTIKLYITGNEFKNLKSAELSNWTGKVYIGNRKHTKLIQNIEELKVPGIYLLIANEIDQIQKKIYIGEADEVNKRINDHFQKKDWWFTFIIFISKDANLTKAHVRYLEKRIHAIAKMNLSTLIIDNNQDPTGSKLPQSDIDEMEVFLENIIFVSKNLGIIDFTTLNEEDFSNINSSNIFYIRHTSERIDKNGNIVYGKLMITNDGYRLLKDSYIEKKERASFNTHAYYPVRKQFETDEYLKGSEIKGCFLLTHFPNLKFEKIHFFNMWTQAPDHRLLILIQFRMTIF